MKIIDKIKYILIHKIQFNDERKKFQSVLNEFDRNNSILEVGNGKDEENTEKRGLCSALFQFSDFVVVFTCLLGLNNL